MDENRMDQMIDAGTAVLGITVRPEWRPGLRIHLEISLGHATAVLDFECPDDLDPAPVFTP